MWLARPTNLRKIPKFPTEKKYLLKLNQMFITFRRLIRTYQINMFWMIDIILQPLSLHESVTFINNRGKQINLMNFGSVLLRFMKRAMKWKQRNDYSSRSQQKCCFETKYFPSVFKRKQVNRDIGRMHSFKPTGVFWRQLLYIRGQPSSTSHALIFFSMEVFKAKWHAPRDLWLWINA